MTCATPSANSTFTIRIVNSTTGANLGNLITVSIPKNASPQFSFDTLLSMAGAAKTSDHNYSLYIQNSEATSGYQHVTFNGTSGLFENNSNCANTLNQVVKAAYPSLVLTNLHTSLISTTTYPMLIDIHNYWNAAVTYGVYVYDAGTADSAGVVRAGSGAQVGSKTYTIAALYLRLVLGHGAQAGLGRNGIAHDDCQQVGPLAASDVTSDVGGEGRL